MSSSREGSTSSCSGKYRDGARKELVGPMTDDRLLMIAAKRHRLPGNAPTDIELRIFIEIGDDDIALYSFLMIRNTTLLTWQSARNRECTAFDVRDNLNEPYCSDMNMIHNVIHYLTRYGYINYGRFQRRTPVIHYLPEEKRSVIVIGAGAAGIAAALQLISFGLDVTIVEARDRIGGRVETLRPGPHSLETGCDTIRNLEESSLIALIHQVDVESETFIENDYVFVDGKPANPQRDKLIKGLYTQMKDTLRFLAHEHDQRDERGYYISRQQAYENLFVMIERSILINYYNYCKADEEIALKREMHYKQLHEYRNTALMAERKLEGVPAEDKLLRRSLKVDMAKSLEKFEKELEAFHLADNHCIAHQKNSCCKQYMIPDDYTNYNFVLGFEELCQGAQLEKIQFSPHTSGRDPNGEVMRLKNGIANLFHKVIANRKIDIRLRSKVREIDYTSKCHVDLKVEEASGELASYRANMVVCTIPIGVLKKTIQNCKGAPVFHPPLPKEKVNAIKCMGSGLINKVIFIFNNSFWAVGERTQFATVSPSIIDRGAMMVWSSVPGSKVLTTYYIGDKSMHEQPDDVIIESAMEILRKTFPSSCPPKPISAYVTRWQDDEFCYGSGSFMGLRTEIEHFDELIKPLNNGTGGKDRVYFAGEHTSSTNPGELEGAWLSGLRVATDLANTHCGLGFVEKSQKSRRTRPMAADCDDDKDAPGCCTPSYDC